jgi:hypothetical protein
MKTTAGGTRVSHQYGAYRAHDRTFRPPAVIHLFQDPHRVWPAALELRIPQQTALWPNVTFDEAVDSWAERLFLI